MQRIVLTDEQSRILENAKDKVEVYDSRGRLVSFLRWNDPRHAEAMAWHLHRLEGPKEPGVPSDRVQAFLRRLEEIEHTEGITPEKVREVLQRVKSGEAI